MNYNSNELFHAHGERSLADELTTRPDSNRELLDFVPAILWRANAQTFQFTFVSSYAETLLGYPLRRWTDEPEFWKDHIYSEDREWAVARRSHAAKEEGDYDVEYRMVSSDGRALWVRELGRVLTRGSSGELAGVIVDLSRKRSAQQALGKDKRWLRQMIDTIPVQIWSGPTDGSLDFCNARWRSELGLSLEQLQGEGWQRMLHPADRDRVLEAWHESVTSGTPYEQEERHLLADGQYRWFLCRGVPLRENGKIIRWFGANTDIEGQKQAEEALRQSEQRLRLLLDLGQLFVSKLDLREFFDAVLDGVRRLAGWHWASILLPAPASHELTVYLSSDNSYLLEGYTLPIDGSLQGQAYRSGKPVAFHIEDLPNLCPVYRKNQRMQDIARSEHIRAGCALPLLHEGQVIGVLFLMTRIAQDSPKTDLDFLQELAKLVATSLSNALRYDVLNESREKLVDAKNFIEDQIRAEFSFETVVGVSKAIRNVLQQVETVAPTDSTVLIFGETGTGKELIARAIHDRSTRSDQSFIKVDRSAIPGTLMESELFGHEKGAFTGAVAQRLGRFEIADKGTLFLDEVGDIPAELQPKLLRVLQDQALERLGSNRTRHLDVRIIAATNRNLEKMVEKGEFREDLYYRLKVFPITIPPLRERPDDIPPLVRHYVAKYAQRMKKEIKEIPAHAMEVFTRYLWPGNVRELQHFLERSVVLSPGNVLQAPLRELEEAIRTRPLAGKPSPASRTMEEIERESILQALRDSNWVVGGPHGAAAKLGLKRTTLASRMESLGISRHGR